MFWTFDHKGRSVRFGPYPTRDEAKAAFQRVYGYWPGNETDVAEQ